MSDRDTKDGRSNDVLTPTRISRRLLLSTLAALPALHALPLSVSAQAQAGDPLPSWNDGRTKQSILEFVAAVTREGSPNFVPPSERIATFDNDGTLWVEHPMYTQLAFALDRVVALAPEHPEWKDKAALQGGARTRHEDPGRNRASAAWSS